MTRVLSLKGEPCAGPLRKSQENLKLNIEENCKSCPAQVTWKIKFKCQICLSLCPECPVCPDHHDYHADHDDHMTVMFMTAMMILTMTSMTTMMSKAAMMTVLTMMNW